MPTSSPSSERPVSGLFLFYGFEACGGVAEEVDDPTRRIPRAMQLTILIGGVSGLFSYAGYVLAAPNLQEIVDGEVADPIPSILEDTLGVAGSKVFLVIAVTAFVSCVLSLQAAGSRLLYSSGSGPDAADELVARAHVPRHAVPTNALLVACVVPILICLYVYVDPDQLPRVTAFAVLGIYIAFQAVVLAALRQRIKGWRPAGNWNLGCGRDAGQRGRAGLRDHGHLPLLKPGDTGTLIDDWVVAVGLFVVLATGLLYLFIAKPDRHSEDVAEDDAIEVANLLRSLREQSRNP